jgi:hypothetical protein
MQIFTTLVTKFGLDRETAFRTQQEMDADPGRMSKALYQRFVLMRRAGVSPEMADFLVAWNNHDNGPN